MDRIMGDWWRFIMIMGTSFICFVNCIDWWEAAIDRSLAIACVNMFKLKEWDSMNWLGISNGQFIETKINIITYALIMCDFIQMLQLVIGPHLSDFHLICKLQGMRQVM